jgi:hypothetical protein
MANETDVASFLDIFRVKLQIWGLYYMSDRDKNFQTMLDLEFTSLLRRKIIDSIVLEDYCEGPKKDKLFKGSDMWVFGKSYREHEIYIKVTLGTENNKVVCISFHIAEHPLSYPFKNS